MTLGPKIPDSIHIDANMHPWLYRHLHVFPLVFDNVSLWSFNPHLMRLHSNKLLTVEQAADLFFTEDSAFFLGASDGWFDPHGKARSRRFFHWHEEFDPRLVAYRRTHPHRVTTFQNPESMRQHAWDLADALAKGALSLVRGDTLKKVAVSAPRRVGGPEQVLQALQRSPVDRLVSAYQLANLCAQEDKRRFEELSPGTDSDLETAQFCFDGTLPPIIFQRPGDGYKERLDEGLALSCLFYEHFTKSQMLAAIQRNTGIAFPPFVFPAWHQLLTNGLSLVSTMDIYPHVPTFQRLETELDDRHDDPLVVKAFIEEFAPGIDFLARFDIVLFLKHWRAAGGPRFLREVAAVFAARVVARRQSDDLAFIRGIKAECDRRVQRMIDLGMKIEDRHALIQLLGRCVRWLVMLAIAAATTQIPELQAVLPSIPVYEIGEKLEDVIDSTFAPRGPVAQTLFGEYYQSASRMGLGDPWHLLALWLGSAGLPDIALDHEALEA